MHVLSATIDNLRSIASARLALNNPAERGMLYPNVNVILGNNGAGKSTLLRAIAMGILAPSLGDSGYRPDSMVRRAPSVKGRSAKSKAAKGAPPLTGRAGVTLTLHAQDWPATAPALPGKGELSLAGEIAVRGDFESFVWTDQPAKDVAAQLTDTYYKRQSSAFFLAGYGATRRVETSERLDPTARDKARSPRYARVAGLFEDHIALIPLESWLPDYREKNRGRYTQVIHLINKLLPPNCRLAEVLPDGAQRDYLFEMAGTVVPFRALSDGYKAYIGWIGDMLYHVCMNSPSGKKLVENHGVVLIDEVDLHLHPEWQQTVLPTLSKALPNVQFIVTTHSPLVVGSLEASNLFVLDVTGDGALVTRRPEKVHGASAEQILLSPYFGLESTRTREVAKDLRKLADQATADDPKAALEYLKLLAKRKIAS
ncbi:hypothetical protein GCM10027277_29150 [Pseudoduganella ginsengisoli]|uniref:AAA family ATPase n=1 Tax=Pseudoduganella ginsengisoli TaxID=1462440 RepID=A0A6L6Q0J4_9BURK|nr:AAA family ATPase [Pseudoduganella ginsengisoli]MTW03016.1 AAA family ATPase [Pseudoduganella ginsengisoli]